MNSNYGMDIDDIATVLDLSAGEAAGRIAAEAACPCPPGVPVVMPGERITKEITVFLQRYGFSTSKVIT